MGICCKRLIEDILEKYRPSFKQLDVPFIVESRSQTEMFLDGFSVTCKSPDEIRTLLQSVNRTLVFS